MAMDYHTDFQEELSDEPGEKFGITCNMYLNDNYEGGEVLYSVNGKEFSYKPKRGDVIVFPSTHPYYHAVNIVSEGEKAFIRSFWHFEEPETEEWKKFKNSYSPEEFEKVLEEKRSLGTKTPLVFGMSDQNPDTL